MESHIGVDLVQIVHVIVVNVLDPQPLDVLRLRCRLGAWVLASKHFDSEILNLFAHSLLDLIDFILIRHILDSLFTQLIEIRSLLTYLRFLKDF